MEYGKGDPFYMNSRGPLTSSLDNVLACKLAEAARAAINRPQSDSIDAGLILLNHLNKAGFTVFYDKPPKEQET